MCRQQFSWFMKTFLKIDQQCRYIYYIKYTIPIRVGIRNMLTNYKNHVALVSNIILIVSFHVSLSFKVKPLYYIGIIGILNNYYTIIICDNM